MSFLYYKHTDSTLSWVDTPYPGGKYSEHNPSERYTEVVREFGPPDLVDRRKGGVAIWKCQTLKERGFPWYRVEIHDELVPHSKSLPHTDFLYTWYKIDIPKHLIPRVLSISDSITYDPLRQLLRARCHFHGANVATLWLAMKVVQGEMKGTSKEYKRAILSTVPEMKQFYDPSAYDRYVEELAAFNNTEMKDICDRIYPAN